MPRFSTFDEDSSSLAQRGFESPVGGHRGLERGFDSPGLRSRPASSVRLVCLSPDGQSYHTLLQSKIIETRFLSLGEQRDGKTFPQVVRTTLPAWVQSALQIDSALELFCVEGQNTPDRLPRLCLYTSKGAYLLRLTYFEGGSEVAGDVVAVEQPFQAHLEYSYGSEILRIRPAPQRHAGFATMCPGGSMAALVFNKDIQEYSLLLHHSSGKVTTPLVFGMEDLADPRRERIVDFVFPQSKGLSIFSSLSIVLVKGSGDLYSASPIVFDGTVLATRLVDEGLEYLRATLDATEKTSALWRRARAAQQFFLDVFEKRNQFATARLQLHQPHSACNWPVRLQGPILFDNDSGGAPAAVVENFGNSPNLVGFAVGKWNCAADVAVVSPTCLVPRFSFESSKNAVELDDAVCKLGRWVERVVLSKTGKEVLSLELKKDPLVDSLLHMVTPQAVYTLSTNILRKIGRNHEYRTTAWVSMHSSSEQTLVQGIVVPRDVDDDHLMFARQADGSTTSLNVTELQLKHEVDTQFQAPLAITDEPSSGTRALAKLDSTPPLYESIQDLVKKIQGGLGGLAKIVGSNTSYKEIQPDTLAVAIGCKERCDEELILPLLELNKIVAARREKLRAVAEDQKAQLAALQETVTKLLQGQETIAAQIETVESNAAVLQQRAGEAVQQASGMFPQVTEAEYTYFQDMERLKVRCEYMEMQWKKLKTKVSSQCDTLQEDKLSDKIKNLEPEIASKANTLLDRQTVVLKEIRNRLKAADQQVGNIARESA